MRHKPAAPTEIRHRPGGRVSLRRWLSVCAAFILAVPSLSDPTTAGDGKAGRKAAIACQTCHGLDGLSKLPEAPNLAGQVEPYLVKVLTEYRDGTRRNEIMNVVAKPLTDAEIANLAAYYSAIQIDVLPPG